MKTLAVICCLCLVLVSGARAQTNSLVWHKNVSRVDADIHGEALWPLLEDISRQTGWHIFVEPETARVASTKFKDLPTDDALRMLLGNLNFAFVPQTNGPDFLYVFTTSRANATEPVRLEKPVVKKQQHVPNELIVKLKPGADIDALAKLLGAKILARLDKLGIYRLGFPDAAATDAALAELKGNSDVAAVDYNYIFDSPPSPQVIANAPPTSTPRLTLDQSTPNDPCSPVVGLIDTPVQSLRQPARSNHVEAGFRGGQPGDKQFAGSDTWNGDGQRDSPSHCAGVERKKSCENFVSGGL